MSGEGQEPRAPLVRIAELDIDPAQLAAYKAALTEEIDASVALEPGVLTLHAMTVVGSPAAVRILEIYASREAYEAHLQSPHFLTYKATTAPMVRSLRLVEMDPIALRAKNTTA